MTQGSLKDMIPVSWQELLHLEFSKPYFAALDAFCKEQYQQYRVYPPRGQVFRALELLPPGGVKVVIIGQDPYHGAGQANGLAFSVGDGISLPPSLRNIFREVVACGFDFTAIGGGLERWASQGVLLLNSVLTVRSGEAASHAGRGWEQFTDAIIGALNATQSGVVYMLWGGYAHKKGRVVDDTQNLVLKASHPSPLSANRGGWFASAHFKKANEYLRNRGEGEIRW